MWYKDGARDTLSFLILSGSGLYVSVAMRKAAKGEVFPAASRVLKVVQQTSNIKKYSPQNCTAVIFLEVAITGLFPQTHVPVTRRSAKALCLQLPHCQSVWTAMSQCVLLPSVYNYSRRQRHSLLGHLCLLTSSTW